MKISLSLIIFAIVAFISIIIDYMICDRKPPRLTLDEIEKTLEFYRKEAETEKDLHKKGDLLDMIEYWECEKNKLLK